MTLAIETVEDYEGKDRTCDTPWVGVGQHGVTLWTRDDTSNELRKPSMSTGAVADAVGYQSEATFERAFKSYMGLTLGQWKKGGEF